MNNLYRILQESAGRHPEKTAVEFDNVSVSYRRLKESADRFAAGLAGLGLSSGDRIAVLFPNLPHFPIAFFGILKIGGVVVPISPTLHPDLLQSQIVESDVRGIVYWGGFRKWVSQAFPKADSFRKRIVLADSPGPEEIRMGLLLEGNVPLADTVDVDPDATAVIAYTAGITTDPKGVELTHAGLLADAEACHWFLKTSPDDRVLGIIPLAHPVGITLVMNTFFQSGSRMTLMPKFDPQAVLLTIAKYQSTHLIGAPTMFRSLIQAASDTTDTSSLKTCLSIGEGLDQEILNRFASVFKAPLLEGYGLTEASPMVSFNNPVPDRKAGCLGLPLPGIDMKIVDENGNHVKPGEVGEVVVKGPVVMKGYWKRPEETALALKQGWLWTGDLAVLHDDGFAFWKGRRSDIILKSGFQIYPREVETAICDHPKIREAAVTGVPDPVIGEEIHAYAVLKEGETATSEEIVEHCRRRLVPYKCPRVVHFVASLPKSTTGRVIRHKLRSVPKI